jgi:hypothetical protein
MPAGALLAGQEIQRLSQRFNPVKFDYAFGVVVILGISLAAFYYFGPRTNDPTIPRTLALKALAREIEAQRRKDVPLMYVDAPAALQIYLNTWQPRVSFEQAAENLRGKKRVYVAINDLSKLQTARRPSDPPIFILFPKQADLATRGTRIISNRPEQ